MLDVFTVEDRTVDAEHLYEAAIRSAYESGFAHCEAVANECAAQFYSARGLAKIAHLYLRDAGGCYLRWGAAGKVTPLYERYPHLRQERAPGARDTMGPSAGRLDVETVSKLRRHFRVRWFSPGSSRS
jgi:GAF domain-containing protein